MARKTGRRRKPDDVKASADRAEARAAGKPVEPSEATPSVLNPPEVGPKRRDVKYTAELGKLICEMLADGMTLNAVCRRPEIPVSASGVRKWAADPEHPFSAQYVRAREIGYLAMADEIMDICDDGTNDWKTRGTGEDEVTVVDHEHIARSKLRVDTRKWLLSKALPKIYGDKVAVTDPDGGALTIKFAV